MKGKMAMMLLVRLKRSPVAFLAGTALATPFFASMLPTKWLYVSLLLLAPFFFRIVIEERRFLSIPPQLVMPIVLAAGHIAAIFLTATEYYFLVLRDTIVSLIVVGIGTLGRRTDADFAHVISGFYYGVVLLCLPFAVFGLIKYAALQYGVQFAFLGAPYPPLGSLKLDYNIFGLSALTGGILTLAKVTDPNVKRRLLITAISVIFLLSAIVAGSRRIVFLVPICVLGVLFMVRKQRGYSWRSILISSAILLSLVCALYVLGYFAPIIAILKTINFDSVLGFNTRTARWDLALGMLKDQQYWLPSGFNYHEAFSCRFSGCKDLDYPHSPLLSEWIILGGFGLLVSLIFYFQLAHLIFRASSNIVLSGLPMIVFAAFTHSLISGDTLLSHPQLIALVTLLSYCGPRDGSELRWRGRLCANQN